MVQTNTHLGAYHHYSEELVVGNYSGSSMDYTYVPSLISVCDKYCSRDKNQTLLFLIRISNLQVSTGAYIAKVILK